MLNVFTEELAVESLGERWTDVTLGASAVFWLAFSLSWIFGPGGGARLSAIDARLSGATTVLQVVVLLAGLAVIAASNTAMRGLSFQIIRALEGYWPGWLGPVQARLTERWWRRYLRLSLEQQSLDDDRARWTAARPAALRGIEQPPKAVRRAESRHWAGMLRDSARAASVEQERARLPSSYQRFKPTLLGNILAAAEERPGYKYGLDAVICWPRLWLLLGDAERKEVGAARRSLDAGAALIVWGLLDAALSAFWVSRPWVAGLIAATGV